MVKVLVKKLDPNVKLPSYKTEGSSGMDLMARIDETITIPPKKSKLIPTGLSVAIPNDCEIQIRPRSGLAAKSNISVLNTQGTIDSDYRGELKIILYNHGDNDFKVNNNEKKYINSIGDTTHISKLRDIYSKIDSLQVDNNTLAMIISQI